MEFTRRRYEETNSKKKKKRGFLELFLLHVLFWVFLKKLLYFVGFLIISVSFYFFRFSLTLCLFHGLRRVKENDPEKLIDSKLYSIEL